MVNASFNYAAGLDKCKVSVSVLLRSGCFLRVGVISSSEISILNGGRQAIYEGQMVHESPAVEACV